MAYKCVLVPIDFSENSLYALQLAVEHFSGPETALALLHVCEPLPDNHRQWKTGGRVDQMRTRLQALVDGGRGKFREVRALIEPGEQPAATIVAAAKSEGADLVVMGSHGGTGLGKLLFGGTTYEVSRKLKCSVMVCRRS